MNVIEKAEEALQAGAYDHETGDVLRELLAIVKRLPKDADGNPSLPGDIKYAPRNPSDDTIVECVVEPYRFWVDDVWGEKDVPRCRVQPQGGAWPVYKCHSTRAAAEAAGGEA